MAIGVPKVGVKRYVTPRQVFQLSQDEYDKLKENLVTMYSSVDSVDDPVVKAAKVIERCCLAIRDDGAEWLNAADDFDRRLRVFGYDSKTQTAIPGFFSKDKNNPAFDRKMTKVFPKELNIKDKNASIGSSSLLNSNEKKDVDRRFKQLIKDFPDLDNATDRDMALLLSKLYVISDRILNYALDTGNLPKSSNFDTAIFGNIERALKLLGIDRPSRQKAIDKADEGSVAELVKEYEEYMVDDFIKNEKLWQAEELALLIRKHERLDDEGQPELDEVMFERLAGMPVQLARQYIEDPYYANTDDLMKSVKQTTMLTISKKDKPRITELLGIRNKCPKNQNLAKYLKPTD
jgi:hypothetical protein